MRIERGLPKGLIAEVAEGHGRGRLGISLGINEGKIVERAALALEDVQQPQREGRAPDEREFCHRSIVDQHGLFSLSGVIPAKERHPVPRHGAGIQS